MQKPLAQLTAYEAILRYYEYDKTLSYETMDTACKALEQALEKDPACGVVWTMLARIYGDRISFGLSDSATSLEKVRAFAEKGVFLHPDNPRAWLILAFARFLDNDLSAARNELDRAYALDPASVFFMDAIGYLYTLLGEWERGSELAVKAIECNPHHRHLVYYALWLNLFRQENYEEALRQTQNFRSTGSFWAPLARAATLGQLGNVAEGKIEADKLLNLNPHIPVRGRDLITNYIKSPEIVERVIAGLRKVGLSIE
jgi:tetratricopeptide (TPR) repeat protein